MTREEAIEEIKSWDFLDEKEIEAIHTLIPELAESEDKRIGNVIYCIIRDNKEVKKILEGNGVSVDNALAYLEKQKQNRMQPVYDNQESFESALDKAWKSYNECGSRTVDSFEDNYIECAHAKGFREGYLFGLEKQKETKWSPSEGEMGVLYKLCYLSNQITDKDDTELTRLYQDLKREYFNGRSFENMFPSEKQKEQIPITESKRLANEVIEYLARCGYSPVLKDDSKKEHFHIDIPRHKDDFWHSEEYKHCRSVLGEYYMEGDYGSDTYTLYIWRAKKEQKPVEKEVTLTNFEEILNTFLFDFANSPIEDCEPKEYIKKHSAEILKAAYKELNAKLQQDIFEAKQEGIRDGYEVAKAEQKSVEYLSEDRVFAIMKKLSSLSFCVPLGSDEEKRIDEITHDVRSLLDYPILKPAEWSKNDTVFLNEIIDFFENKTTRLQHDIDMYAHWLKSLSERFNLQPKQEWGEEDEKIINDACCWIAEYAGYLMDKNYGKASMLMGLTEKLKSLRLN